MVLTAGAKVGIALALLVVTGTGIAIAHSHNKGNGVSPGGPSPSPEPTPANPDKSPEEVATELDQMFPPENGPGNIHEESGGPSGGGFIDLTPTNDPNSPHFQDPNATAPGSTPFDITDPSTWV